MQSWRVPGGEYRRLVEDNAPAWWHGDADASQSFLEAMGVIDVG